MKNRSIIARMQAKVVKPKKVKKVKKEVVIEPPVIVKQYKGKDPETGEVELVYNTAEEAEGAGFNFVNIKSAISTGNKYKGHLWEFSE